MSVVTTPSLLATIQRTSILRERTFPLARILEVLDILRDERATGTLVIDMVHGGISNIRLREEQKLENNS